MAAASAPVDSRPRPADEQPKVNRNHVSERDGTATDASDNSGGWAVQDFLIA